MTVVSAISDWGVEVGTLLSGLTVFASAVISAVLYIIRKAKKEIEDSIPDLTMRGVLTALGEAALKEVAAIDPDEVLSFDFRLRGGEMLHIPVTEKKWIRILPSVKIMVGRHDSKETLILVDSDGYTRLPWFFQKGTERINVLSGKLIDRKAGKEYVAGEVWEIAPDEERSADLHDCLCSISYRPPLPNSLQVPINLYALPSIYDYENVSDPSNGVTFSSGHWGGLAEKNNNHS
jgi:hypothetical protein